MEKDIITGIQLGVFETEKRLFNTNFLEVLNYTPNIKSGVLLIAPGTATLFLAKKGEKLINEIYQFLKFKKGDEKTICSKFLNQFSGLNQLTLNEASIMHKNSASLASIKYGHKTLLESIFIPDKIKVIGVPFPYNGGLIAEDKFQMIHYYKDEVKDDLEGFIVIHNPNLTKAETDILKKLPKNQFELNIGTNPVGFATVWIAVAVAVSLATGICCPNKNEDFVIPNYLFDPYEVHLPEDVIKKISVSAAASEILNIRRNFLMHKY